MQKCLCWWCGRRLSLLTFVPGSDNNVCDDCWNGTPTVICIACNHRGIVGDARCEACRGIGRVRVKED